MRRVLVTGGYNINKAGVATIVYRWGQEFDNQRVVYDYLMMKGLPRKEYVETIRNKGGEIIAPEKKLTGLSKIKWLYKNINRYQDEVIHINIDVAYKALIYILLAKRAGIKKVALHSHCSFIDDNKRFKRMVKVVLHYMTRGYVIKKADVLLACSAEAALWMFGKKVIEQQEYIQIFNGLDIDSFAYDDVRRKSYRKEMGIDEKDIVLGNVGRFSYQKNHSYLIDIFEMFHTKHPKSKLVLIGNGDLEDEVKRYVSEKKLGDSVLFLGQRNDVNFMLSMMDVFVMPSRFEGLPLVLVEAQIASLPCVISNRISPETKISEFLEQVSLDNISDWVVTIEKFIDIKRENLKIKNIRNYTISDSAIALQTVLEEL